ncbi:Gti1/Pac2 family-domain-containing protein [Chytriomyces sp. MP71]|nr:Gti1/Pac2 family-domain-containing protein [Chytriomyces sp. MP71]
MDIQALSTPLACPAPSQHLADSSATAPTTFVHGGPVYAAMPSNTNQADSPITQQVVACNPLVQILTAANTVPDSNAILSPPLSHSPQLSADALIHSTPVETFCGFVRDTLDAQILVEACIKGLLPLIHDLPPGVSSLPIRSGTTIVFAENSDQSLRMRWRDGASWSCSRICGPFLLYREVEAMHRIAETRNVGRPGGKEKCTLFVTTSVRKNTRLVVNGFAKRTISITSSVDGKRYRVINYFYPTEVEYLYSNKKHHHARLPVPSRLAFFEKIKVQVAQQCPKEPKYNRPDEMKTEQLANDSITYKLSRGVNQLTPNEAFFVNRFERETSRFQFMEESMAYFRKNPNWAQSPVKLAPIHPL